MVDPRTPRLLVARYFRADGSLVPWIGLAVVVAWLVHPVLTPSHVEGFSASIESLAIHLSHGALADYDRLHPANLEFFALSRLGTVTFVAALVRWTGLSSEGAMRTMMWLGFASLIWASVVLVRRWTGASTMVVVGALLLVPGVSESAFFYNDNVLSAALAVGALALLGTSPGTATTALAGLLFGGGVVARLDAVLLAPAVVLIAYEQHHRVGRDFVRRALVFTGAALVPVLLVPGSVGASILDVVRISNYAVTLWNRPPSLAPHAREFAYFVGTPAALLVAFGALRLTKDRAFYRLALLSGVPIIFNLVALGKIWQSRQLLPMTPFFAALAVCGFQYLVVDEKEHSRRPLRIATLAVVAIVLFGPIGRLQISDGPRAPYGRFWAPRLWTRWQHAVDENMADIARLISGVNRSATTAIITDTWDADRYLHLQLQRSGFVVQSADRLQSACAKTGELFVKGPTRVIHVRLHQPFLQSWRSLAAQRWQSLGLPCLVATRPSDYFLLSPGSRVIPLLEASPLHDRLNARSLIATYFATGYDRIVAIRMSSSDIPALSAGLATAAARDAAPNGAPVDLERAEQMMASQIWRHGEHR